MDGLQDETKLGDEGSTQQTTQRDDQGEAAQAQVVSAGEGGAAVAHAHKDYEAALAERDARIAELEGEIAEAAKTAEGAEKLRAEMDELRRKGDEERVGFELQLAGARNVKAARALLADHDGDIEKLKAAEPWLFSAPAAPAPAGATGLPSAGAAGADESAQMSRWRRIAGLPESEE
ncbi:hypothetical protein [Collinsella phocaeensis]|uniref:hypothetical protein n=1 Tax=Collinsella phocaeensis TaxID=1871016 RepID=UPI0009300877|nr:hypothetical protein [Collinsella phocaeensis]